MKILSAVITGLLLVPSLSFAATLTSMNKDEVTSAFSDKTITTIDAVTLDDKVIANTFTGFLSKDGKLTGHFHEKPNGSPQDDKGTWQVNSDGMLCYKWDNWDRNKEKCVGVYKLNNGLLIVNSSNGFESMILDKDIKSGNTLGK